MATRSRLRHSMTEPIRIGLDRIHPPGPSEHLCEATQCPYAGMLRDLKWGFRRLSTWLCWYHFRELERLLAAQGADWGGRGGRAGEARLYYASKKGFHAF
jgi:hypothetical protein